METGTLPNSRGYTFLVHKFGAYQLLDIERLKIGLTYILINYYDTVIRKQSVQTYAVRPLICSK